MNEWLEKKTMIKKEVQQRLSYPYLRKFIEKPEIDEVRLLALMLPFTKEQLSLNETVKYITTATLIQIALDTHEKVTASSNEIAIDQQLTVLAGDYFSGLYYQILAELKDIRMIRALSDAVKSINENKIVLYQQEHQSIESLMASVCKIETEIVERFYTAFRFQSAFPLVSRLLFAKRLLREKQSFLESGHALTAQAIASLVHRQEGPAVLLDNGSRIVQVYDRYIDQAKEEAEKMLDYRSPAHFGEQLYGRLYNEVFRNKTYAEEG
ncbi:heptaprenyl diphosphate synthase component 1 [Bacillus badius]|uniref:heptaprenyl diphosphate synthase component 1 n=1 Tax=Bacillus badius TaxID=1455 RepID=UPI00059750E2|nr:heptaprenyl diphosphate synthase component 1 [Bacillus badius]KIL75137.1 Heptaprenyl diphosphate synthase component I [Bacillus badius]